MTQTFRSMIALELLLFIAMPVMAQDSPTVAARQYAELVKQFEQEGAARMLAPRFLELAEGYPDDPVAVDALLWVVANVRGRNETTRALEALEGKYLNDPRLGPACEEISQARAVQAEKLLRALLERSPHQLVRAQACLHLARLLDVEANVVQQLKSAPELAPRVLQYYGREYGQHLAQLTPRRLEQQREQIYQTMLDSFADVKLKDVALGQLAEKSLFALRHLAVGKMAPEIAGTDIFGQPLKLSDYRGKVVMLSFWGHW